MREAILAVDEGRFEQAIGYLASAITRDPSRVEELRSRPELAPIRANLDQLLNRVTQVSKIRAESDLARIELSMERGRLAQTAAVGHPPGNPGTAGAPAF